MGDRSRRSAGRPIAALVRMCRAPDESEAYPEMDAATGVNVHGFSGQTLITYVMAKEQREAVCYTCNACS